MLAVCLIVIATKGEGYIDALIICGNRVFSVVTDGFSGSHVNKGH